MSVDKDVVWMGPFAGMVRPLPARMIRFIAGLAGSIYIVAAAATAPMAFGLVEIAESDTHLLGILQRVLVVILAVGVGLIALAFRLTDEAIPSIGPWVVGVVFASATVTLGVGLVAAGPRFGVFAVYFVVAPIFAVVVLRPRWASGVIATYMAACLVALLQVDGAAVPFAQWVQVLAAGAVGAVALGMISSQLNNARQQLATINARFRQFLAPQVADVLTAGGDSLSPHRSEIAVFFVDLRGFTSFTNAVTPERVVDVLAEYYATVGTIVDQFDGTIGGFDGDGVFAFLGDPTPNGNAAADALAMARQIATRLDERTAMWSTDAAGLGYGIGLSFGGATVGLVGFEGRLDYTPVGACVNKAARLCADAKHGEILIDDELRKSAKLRSGLTRRKDVDLKGFGEVKTYAISH